MDSHQLQYIQQYSFVVILRVAAVCGFESYRRYVRSLSTFIHIIHTQNNEANNSRVPSVPAAFMIGTARRTDCFLLSDGQETASQTASPRRRGATATAAAAGLAVHGELDLALVRGALQHLVRRIAC